MLGHSAPFAHIHAINLTQNKSLILKRIGYLMCSLFFNKDSDLLIMLVSTILKDLNSTDVHEVVICLTALGNIMNNTIASGIIDAVVKLTNHSTDLVRKKSILILQKIVNFLLSLENLNRCRSHRLQRKVKKSSVRQGAERNVSRSESLLQRGQGKPKKVQVTGIFFCHYPQASHRAQTAQRIRLPPNARPLDPDETSQNP